jgi:hypothetical protein
MRGPARGRDQLGPENCGNGEAGHSESDGAAVGETDSDSQSDEVQEPQKKKKWNGRMEFTLFLRWVTGENLES